LIALQILKIVAASAHKPGLGEAASSVFHSPINSGRSRIATEALPQPPQTRVLRSGAQYATTADEWIYRNPKFIQSFAKACEYFKSNQPIPQDLLTVLESFTISRREYYEYIAKREDKVRHVYLQDGKIKFNAFTQPPHGTAIGIIQTQVIRQLPPDNIFIVNNDCNSL
jgi:hypothetical protein